jgi:ankyrin repeat protein
VIPVIEKLLEEGADINATSQRTALHVAAENGNLEIVELLIERGADVNVRDIHGRTPLVVAIAEHQQEIAERLAHEETDVSVRANDGSTLLMAAVRAEDVELVRWAIDRGTDLDAVRPKKNHATALMMAAGMGNPEIVQLLLTSGADPAVTNHEGKTALDLAKGDEVRELLQAALAERATSPEIAEIDSEN